MFLNSYSVYLFHIIIAFFSKSFFFVVVGGGLYYLFSQVKCLRLLQLYRPPAEQDKKDQLNEALRKILIKSDSSESANKANADHAILFEAVNLLILYGPAEADQRLHQQALALLGRFISVKDANIRYLGLDTMGRMAKQVRFLLLLCIILS